MDGPRLRAGKDVADLALLLDLVANDIFDRTAVELCDLLERVEAYGHTEVSVSGQLFRQCKDLGSNWLRIERSAFAEGEAYFA